ncbi:hypothetical protein GCM10011352_02450 [Marinobacterium zhoushanense]|uniref:Uncharacterized protein n=1 Tax=Marinobacterium zhoushanense TaxID=1679163 RepID=A0ABQ1JZE9_9GAMM|nr:hypothetical protein [Marinobacterium zhoushanense]GGB80259.1 hypothetical protein GCM10011352_02450 [Marinobacterium zhoushanense]
MNIRVPTAAIGSSFCLLSQGRQLLLQPLVLAILLQAIISMEQLDLLFASWLYAQEGYGWALRDSWLFGELIHKGGRDLSIALLLGMMGMLVLSWWHPGLTRWRRVLGYLVVAPARPVCWWRWLSR